jgi:hypothetical protein
VLTPVGLLINVGGLIWSVDTNKRRSVPYLAMMYVKLLGALKVASAPAASQPVSV